jgi:hypothetical protein
MTSTSIDDFIDRLAAVEMPPGCNNFFDHSVPGNALRRQNLAAYLGDMLDRAPKGAPAGGGARLPGHEDYRCSVHQPHHVPGPS